MATRACPRCGSQYVASVRRCIDCDVMLVDDVRDDVELAAPAARTVADGDHIAYELEGWGNQLKVTLRGMLERAGIPNVWEASALLVPAAFEEQVDELVAAVEGGEAEELADDAVQVAFDVEVLTPDELADLDARLIADHIPHSWTEEGELLVAEDDEEAVNALIEDVLEGEAEAGDDGLALHAALDELYVAVDKLLKDPAEAKLVRRYTEAADGLDGLGIPYGLSGNEWQALLDQVAALTAAVDPDAADDTDVDAERDEAGDADDAVPGEEIDEDGEHDGVEGEDDDDDDDEGDGGPEAREDRARRLAGELRARLQDLV